jgi:hypothetical protein
MGAGPAIAALAAVDLLQKVQSDREQAASLRLQSSIAQAQAQRERELAAQQADDYQRQQGAQSAARRARQAASGVALAGSPLLADDAATGNALLNAARIRAGGDERARQIDANDALARSRQPSAALSFLRYGDTLLRDTQGHWGT